MRLVPSCNDCKSDLERETCYSCGGCGEGYTSDTLCSTCGGTGNGNGWFCQKCYEEEEYER